MLVRLLRPPDFLGPLCSCEEIVSVLKHTSNPTPAFHSGDLLSRVSSGKVYNIPGDSERKEVAHCKDIRRSNISHSLLTTQHWSGLWSPHKETLPTPGSWWQYWVSLAALN